VSNSATLWLAVLGLGAYHGINPAMGWPLAVARGLEQRRASAVFATLLPLAGGHLLAMAIVLVPFAWLSAYGQWSVPIRLGASVLVLLFGAYKVIRPRHPRALARVRPTQLAWWSFLMATAHGAGLMLLPFMLGLCSASAPEAGTADASWSQAGHASVLRVLAQSGPGTALAVASVHTLVTLAAGGLAAWLVYRWLGLGALRSAWLNLDVAWGTSLVVAGAAGALLSM
jgi:hypothetical protein